MQYSIVATGPSASFPAGDPFFDGASASAGTAIVCIGETGKLNVEEVLAKAGERTVLLELGSECLAAYLPEGAVPPNVLGFARYPAGGRLSPLVELVKLASTSEEAVAGAVAIFQSAGLQTAVCTDQAGRILDRLVRPKYNAALRLADEGLATAEAIDLTCRLGLGYPEGPIERVVAGGLEAHYRICRDLFEIYGTPAYAPARLAVAAARRAERKS
jgi:3-hydroxybutyryl-CoA dehydrogenase